MIFELIIPSLLFTYASVLASEQNTRIVGGVPVDIRSHPYQVSISVKTSNGQFIHNCGGSVIHERIILTAAHCVFSSPPGSFLVLAGNTLNYGPLGNTVAVERIITHQNYNARLIQNDIALIKLKSNVGINGQTIKAITLASANPTAGTIATVSGWGSLYEGGPTTNNLQNVDLPIVDHTVCQNIFKTYYKLSITQDMLCAGVYEGGKSSCQGDSGGPLVSNNNLVGVVSWGVGCARAGVPAVFASVAHFRPWIIIKMAELLAY